MAKRVSATVPESALGLLSRVRQCNLCAGVLPGGARPVLQFDPRARILVTGQAPGRKVHASGVPFDDASGERLRRWMGVSPDDFYDPSLIAIVPMAFCYPGRGAGGDLPPLPQCAATWRSSLLSHLQNIEFSLIIGQHAQAYHFPANRLGLTHAVRHWRDYWPQQLPLPHPSPRNNIWLRRNPWFEEEVVPQLRCRVRRILEQANQSGGGRPI